MAERKSSSRGATATRSRTTTTSGVEESEIARLKVDDLRSQLRRRGVSGISGLRKDDLVKSLVRSMRAEGRGGGAMPRTAAGAKKSTTAAARTTGSGAKKSTTAAARTTASKQTSGTTKRTGAAAKRTSAAKNAGPATKRTGAAAKRTSATKRATTAKSNAARKTTTARKSTAAKSAPAAKSTTARKSTGTKSASVAKSSPAKQAGASATTGARSSPVRSRTSPATKRTTTTKRTPTTKQTAAATKRTPVGGGGARSGTGSSRSLKYAQRISSPQERPERPGRSLVTTNHEVIRAWAEARNAVPATIAGTEREGRAGVLTFDFPGYRGGGKLRQITWNEWFDTFDTRSLNFIYQEQRSNAQPSNFFRTESPEREDG